MRAVNLIPADARRGSGPSGGGFKVGPSYLIVGLLAVGVVFAVLSVMASNTISSRRQQLASLQVQITRETGEAADLSKYAQFEQMAQQRAQTVRTIAASRFDWQGALNDLSKVVPANTSLESLNASVVPGAGSSAASGLRSALTAPAFEITGCTGSQDDVAALMSRLRLVNGVTTVTLSSSQKGGSAGSSSSATSCPSGKPAFDIVVFFQPVANAGANGVTSLASTAATAASTGGAATSTASTAGGAR